MENNLVGWFEIPVQNMDRALEFYNHVFNLELNSMMVGTQEMAMFPFNPEGKGSSGSLVKLEEFYVPSKDGVVIYFTCPDIDGSLQRVKEKGGQVLQEKKQISPEHGYMGLMLDSEGNRIALHSNS